MCGGLFTLEMAITCTGTCTALAGIDWMGARVRKREANYRRRRTIEAIQIKTNKDTMNLDSGLLLPLVWNPILNSP